MVRAMGVTLLDHRFVIGDTTTIIHMHAHPTVITDQAGLQAGYLLARARGMAGAAAGRRAARIGEEDDRKFETFGLVDGEELHPLTSDWCCTVEGFVIALGQAEEGEERPDGDAVTATATRGSRSTARTSRTTWTSCPRTSRACAHSPARSAFTS